MANSFCKAYPLLALLGSFMGNATAKESSVHIMKGM
jgi:hypothetical protein